MVSKQGLNAYGAVTWGQPFIYQGFNEHCGWMHTSSKADISDAYIEKLSQQNGKWFYEYEGKQLPVTEKIISIKYKEADNISSKIFTAFFTHHGPILTKRYGQYLSLKHNNRDTKGFIQSWLRTKAKSFAEFKRTMDMGANPSNNTVYADAEGNIAYWHGNFYRSVILNIIGKNLWMAPLQPLNGKGFIPLRNLCICIILKMAGCKIVIHHPLPLPGSTVRKRRLCKLLSTGWRKF